MIIWDEFWTVLLAVIIAELIVQPIAGNIELALYDWFTDDVIANFYAKREEKKKHEKESQKNKVKAQEKKEGVPSATGDILNEYSYKEYDK